MSEKMTVHLLCILLLVKGATNRFTTWIDAIHLGERDEIRLSNIKNRPSLRPRPSSRRLGCRAGFDYDRISFRRV